MDRVVFKMLEDEVIAFLPDNPANIGCIDSYMHIGQHGKASWECYYKCKPAKAQVETLTDDDMKIIANKMGDAYVANGYWSDLQFIAEDVLSDKMMRG